MLINYLILVFLIFLATNTSGPVLLSPKYANKNPDVSEEVKLRWHRDFKFDPSILIVSPAEKDYVVVVDQSKFNRKFIHKNKCKLCQGTLFF